MKLNKKRKIKTWLVVVILLMNFLPVAVIKVQANDFTMALLVESPPPVEPEQPPAQPPSQGNYNPPTQPPPREQEFPVWIEIQQINSQYLDDLIPPYQFTDRILTFQGKTNVNDAIIFINLNDNPNVTYTTLVYNLDGDWQWTTPYTLAVGEYNLNVVAINPADPTIYAQTNLTFQIVEQIIPPEVIPPPPLAPTPVIPPTPPKPPVVPPVFKPPLPPLPIPGVIILTPSGKYEFYSLNIRVLNKNKIIFPKDKLKTEVVVNYVGETERQLVDLKFYVLDQQQKIIMEASQPVMLSKQLIFEKNFITSFTINPGRYTIVVEITKNGKIIQSSDYFIVNQPPLFKPYIISLAILPIDFGQYLILLIIILSLIYIIFFIFLYWDKVRADQRLRKITIDDLIKGHYLDCG